MIPLVPRVFVQPQLRPIPTRLKPPRNRPRCTSASWVAFPLMDDTQWQSQAQPQCWLLATRLAVTSRAVPVAEVGCLEVGFSQYGYFRLPAWRPSGILSIGTWIRAAGTQSCSTNVKCPLQPRTWTIPNAYCSRLCGVLSPMQIPGTKRMFLYSLRQSAVVPALRP